MTIRNYIVWGPEIRDREFFDHERDLIGCLMQIENAAGYKVFEIFPASVELRDVTSDAAELCYETCDMCSVQDPDDPSYGMGDFVTRHIGEDRIREDYEAYRKSRNPARWVA